MTGWGAESKQWISGLGTSQIWKSPGQSPKVLDFCLLRTEGPLRSYLKIIKGL